MKNSQVRLLIVLLQYVFTILDKTIHVVLDDNLGILGIILKFDTVTSCNCDVKSRIKVEK